MLLEDLLLFAAVGAALLGVAMPIARFLKVTRWRRPDPLAEAQERLRIAKLEAEAARVNREADKIYEQMYDHDLGDAGVGSAARVAEESDVAPETPNEPRGKGKRHDQG